ncbi:hypothetical protein BDR26DRAFT_894933 [Obelidium mucronatum]|nr:hypothetical protein BDR26DRAFT_894933 [Obelidium mucronatum]
MDGHSFDILISPVTTADEVVKEISKKFKLKDTSSWSLYTVTQKEDKAIRSVEYLADCMLVMQKDFKRTNFMANLKMNKIKETSSVGGDTEEEFKLTLKKRIFKNPKEDLRLKDETEIHLLCCQADHEVNTDFYPIGLREGVKLAALKAHIMLGDYNAASNQLPHDRISATNILQWITPRVLAKASKENTAKMVIEEYSKLKGKSSLEAKIEYLEIVKELRFYGAAVFEIESPGELAFNEPMDLAISAAGVQLIQAVSREIAMVFVAQEIKDVQLDEKTISIVIGKQTESVSEVYEFTSDRAEEMCSLIRDYRGIRISAVKERVYSEAEVANLKKGIEVARANLIENECVRIPGPDTFAAEMIQNPSPGNSKTIRGSLIMPKSLKSMKPSGSSSRSSSQNAGARKKSTFAVFTKSEVPGSICLDYVETDWAFSTTKLVSSILSPQHEASDFAMSLNIFILEYIGLTKGIEAPNRLSKLNAPIAAYIQRMQRLLEQCVDKPILANELYLQIIKMTTKNEDKTSYACAQMWKLMCVCVGVVVPTIPDVLDYLKAHLRRCEAVDPKDKSEKERSKYANYALKTLYQTIRGGKRMHPPSSEEIGCAMKRAPMTIRFYALNRQFRALPIHPSDSIETIYCNLMEKFGLGEASGFAIYQYYAKSELALFAEDKISDVIYKCEKASHASQTSDKVHFIIKKRLFDEPLKPSEHPIEDEFVRWQVVEDVKNDRYPLKPDDLILAAALTAQIQFGDAILGAMERLVDTRHLQGLTTNQNPFSYHEFSTKVIPKRLVSNEMDEKIAGEHGKLCGKSGKECHEQFMMMKLTPVQQQSYTNQLPRECWLAIGFDGIRILARRSLSIFATHPFADLINYIPAKNNILLVTENRTTLGSIQMGMFGGKKPATADAASPTSPPVNDPRAATAPSPIQEEAPPPPGLGRPAKPEKRANGKQVKPDLTVKTAPPQSPQPQHDRKKNMEEIMEDASLELDEEERGHMSPSSPKHKHVHIPSKEVKELQHKLELEQHEKAELEDANEDLRAKVAALKRKLLSAVAIKEKESVKANRVPVSVEANMNLKYQFQKRLLTAKEDYASLLDENRKLAAKIKELESHHSKREVHVSKARLNEVLLWKKKFKDLEAEKHKMEENFAVFIKKLEKAEAERDKIQNDFSEAQIQFAQRLSYDTYSLESLTDLSGSRKSLTRRQTSTTIRNSKPARKSRA